MEINSRRESCVEHSVFQSQVSVNLSKTRKIKLKSIVTVGK